MDKYYKVLQLSKGASKEEIRKAYLKMALRNHPDRHPEDTELYTEKFKEIGEAYNILYNNYSLNDDTNDPFQLFKSLFPNINLNSNTLNIISDIYQKILENNYNFNTVLFFEMIALINKPDFKQKINNYFDESLTIKLTDKKAETLIINQVIDLEQQYKSNTYQLKVKLSKRSKARFPKLITYTKVFTINLLNEKTILENQGNYNLKDKYQGDLEINIIDEKNQLFKRYRDFDLVYTLNIGREDLFNEIYHVIPHFAKKINIYIDKPYRYFVYKIKDYGMIDYNDNYHGDLFIRLEIDIEIQKSPKIKLDNYIIPTSIQMFDADA